MITQTTNLNLIPGVVLPHVNVTQYDFGSRTLQFPIYNGETRFTLTADITAQIQGTKQDNYGFAYDCTVDTTNNIIIADLEQQMTAVKGEVNCELVLFKTGERIGTVNFILNVQKAALNDETIISETELPAIIAEATEQMEAAEASALVSEGYAKGTQDGEAVTSESPYYQNNAEYYSGEASSSATEAASSATDAENEALVAEGFAVGEQNGTPVESGSPYYENNAEHYASEASTSAAEAAAWSSNPPYIGSNGNWFVYDTDAQAFVDSGVVARGDTGATPDITATASVDATVGTPSVTITESGTAENPIIDFAFSNLKGETGSTGATPDITMTASVDSNVGTPSVTVTESGTAENPNIDLTFSNLKGETGDSAGFGTPTASVDSNVGTPSVTVSASGPDTAKVFDFAFSNMKGETGATGATGATPDISVTASVDNNTGTPAVTVTETGTAESPNIDFAFENLKGNTGNGISDISKTSTSGLVDTYTVTYTDGTTTTFTVTNGRDGMGSGDMSQADYDSNSDVLNVGGIAAYVTDQIESLDVSDSAVSGSYVTAVSETDGVIAVTREAADASPTQSSNKLVTSGGVYSALSSKADSATNLAGYGINDAYTTTQTDNAISTAINALDVSDSAVNGSYVTAVSETDGNISVTREAADVTPTASSSKMVTSGGVYTDTQNVYKANGVLGAKNLLPNTATTQVINHVTFTVNSDGSVTANGTASADTSLLVDTSVPTGTYIASGCPSGGSENTYNFQIRYNDGSNKWVTDTGDGISFSGAVNRIAFVIKNGITVSNLVFYPMIRLATDSDDTYQPYAMTNRELTELENVETYTISCTLSGISQDVTFLKKGNEVNFSKTEFGNGTAFSSATGNDVIATLPSELRPQIDMNFVGYIRTAGTWTTSSAYLVVITVSSYGNIYLRGNATNIQSCNYLTLCGSYFTK